MKAGHRVKSIALSTLVGLSLLIAGVVVAGAVFGGRQLLLRFLVTVVVAALGLYIVSDMRLQKSQTLSNSGSLATATTSTGSAKIMPIVQPKSTENTPSTPPVNSTAAYMARASRDRNKRPVPYASEVDTAGEPTGKAVTHESQPTTSGTAPSTCKTTGLAQNTHQKPNPASKTKLKSLTSLARKRTNSAKEGSPKPHSSLDVVETTGNAHPLEPYERLNSATTTLRVHDMAQDPVVPGGLADASDVPVKALSYSTSDTTFGGTQLESHPDTSLDANREVEPSEAEDDCLDLAESGESIGVNDDSTNLPSGIKPLDAVEKSASETAPLSPETKAPTQEPDLPHDLGEFGPFLPAEPQRNKTKGRRRYSAEELQHSGLVRAPIARNDNGHSLIERSSEQPKSQQSLINQDFLPSNDDSSLDAINTAIIEGEKKIIQSLLDRGVLSSEGPITDDDVSTMVYMAFTSSELRQLLASGGTVDDEQSDCNLDQIEIYATPNAGETGQFFVAGPEATINQLEAQANH